MWWGGVLSLLVGLVQCGFPDADGTTITSVGLPNDIKGNPVHAHGAGIYVDNKTSLFYVIGTTQKVLPSALSKGINLYTTPDLKRFTLVSEILQQDDIKVPGHSAPWRIERPKLVHCRNGKYVVWFHLDTPSFGIQMVGVAEADDINGPYTFIHGLQPDGIASYDMTLYQDWDGDVYLVRSAENKFAGISRLSSDCRNTTGIISRGPRMEGNTMFRTRDGTYWMLGSHLTGWSPNAAILVRSPNKKLDGATWTNLGNPSNSSTTDNSQSTFVLPYVHPSGKWSFIYFGDRWSNPHPAAQADYVWLPLVEVKDGFQLPWLETWKVGEY